MALGRFATEDQFQEFCDLLLRKDQDEIGLGLYPTSLWPQLKVQGGAMLGGENASFDHSAIDRRESGPLLSEVRAARVPFSAVSVSRKYRGVLDKAERVWASLAE